MAVHLRLTRVGRHKHPIYRVVAADARMRRDGRFLEVIGTYNPLKESDKAVFKEDRVLDWLKRGAKPSDPVRALLRKTGVMKALAESRKEATPAT